MSRYRSPALRRYLQGLTLFMVLYAIALVGVGYLFRHAPPAGAVAWVAAALPALPIIGVFWIIFRLMAEEQDEYLRMMFVRQGLFATAFCLSVMTVWEFLQNYEVVAPGQGGFGAAFFWFVGLGLGGAWNALTGRSEGCA